uniref:Uncharacterized protein n=1 Tax=Alexandrium catenella TaxID=2925 RepID=A0A7S1SC33_ALECA
MLSALGGKGLGRSKGKGEGRGQRREQEVNLSGRMFDDTKLANWCERMPPGLMNINLSNNGLGDASAKTLVCALLEAAQPIRVLKLFSNRIGDGGALPLAKYIEESQHVLGELHLSHNAIQRDGAEALLMAAVCAQGTTRGGGAIAPRYPSFETVGQCRPVPLWLRLEYNLIEDGHLFQIDMEKKLLATRRDRGYLPDAGTQVPMLCEAIEGYGCSSHGCSLLCPGGLMGNPAGPVVHAAHLRKQRRACDLPGGGHGLSPGGGPRPLAQPAPGDERLPGALKPAAVLPRPRSPCSGVALPIKQCRFVDVRLGSSCEPGPAADTEATVSTREATPEPQRRPAATTPGVAPAKTAPQAGQKLKVARQVTEIDAIKAGYQPENYLQPLQQGDEVTLLHVCEGDEAGWVWAQRLGVGGDVQPAGGWLSLDALVVPPAGA